MAGLTLRSVHKTYGEVPVIKGVDLDIAHGEFVVFVGPSGCGKSTLLRMMPGLKTLPTAKLKSATAWSTMSSPATEASPWSSSPTRSIRI